MRDNINDINANFEQGVETAQQDPFNFPVPGHALTDEPNQWNWDKPARVTDPDQAVEEVINKIENWIASLYLTPPLSAFDVGMTPTAVRRTAGWSRTRSSGCASSTSTRTANHHHPCPHAQTREDDTLLERNRTEWL